MSPYSWSFPGGVTRHVEALAGSLLACGHHVRILAPVDPPDRVARLTHGGACPQEVQLPDHLIPLGRTVGIPANGSVSNLSPSPACIRRLGAELGRGSYDVVHVHEPVVPVAGWSATALARQAVVGTFHAYSTKWLPNAIGTALGARLMLNHLHVRIAVSRAAEWTGRRWFGGHYRVIPNGVHLDPDVLAAGRATEGRGGPLRIVFVGQPVPRKGLPVLLGAFEELRRRIPAELVLVGPDRADLTPDLVDLPGVRVMGRVDDERKLQELRGADVLCAPSLGGESFGMVLTEAFAAGTAVVASDIAGYREVVDDDVDGVLVPPGDPLALAAALQRVHEDPEQRQRMTRAAAVKVHRFSWQRVAHEVVEAYQDAVAVPRPEGRRARAAVRVGIRPADLRPRMPATRLPPLDPEPSTGPSRHRSAPAGRAGVALLLVGGAALAYLAVRKVGLGNVGEPLARSRPAYTVLALAVMCAAMAVRAVSWHAILKAALPRRSPRLVDVLNATMIGVLMSSTLPARLGEPSRALVVARRTGRAREALPVVLGTLVSQTLLNILALVILGIITLSSVDFVGTHARGLVVATVVPVVVAGLVVAAPLVLSGRARRSGRVARFLRAARRMSAQVRAGLAVFREPRLGAAAVGAQLTAWALQCLACYLLLVALDLQGRAGPTAAVAVLFAVNVTAVLPATPANIGVFQAACAAVLHAGWHVDLGAGVAYGVVLQAVEVVTAFLMGVPALVREGMTWKQVRLLASRGAVSGPPSSESLRAT